MAFINIPGYDSPLYIADTLEMNLKEDKKAVITKGWDYVCVVSGLPGVGKSTFAQALAKYFDNEFQSWQICFTGREFREKTINGKKGQAFILDESFADMNTSLSKDPDFISTMNHLQLIRQKNLFLILVLPDFFSLSKNLAIFRTRHLFVPYSVNYSRSDVAVFDREAKRKLYVKGKKFCDYQASEPNFRTDFRVKWFCDEEDYLKRKAEHLKDQSKTKDKEKRACVMRDKLAYWWHIHEKISGEAMAKLINEPERTVYEWIEYGKDRLNRGKLD
jgi:adenylate kinase family enzyme